MGRSSELYAAQKERDVTISEVSADLLAGLRQAQLELETAAALFTRIGWTDTARNYGAAADRARITADRAEGRR